MAGGALGVLVLAAAVICVFAAPAGDKIFVIDESLELVAKADAGDVIDLDMEEPEFTEDGYAVHKEVYAIVADGEDIMYAASSEDAEAILDGIIDRYKTMGSEITDIGFKEDVSIEKREFEYPAPVFDVYEAVSYIVTGAVEAKTYVIKGGDNLWDIAIENRINVDELQAMNPGLDPKRLQIGMEINLYQIQPFISVTFTELVTKEERVAYAVIYEDDAGMYKGQTVVKSPGSYGSREVTSEIIKENGLVVASRVLSENVLTEPVTQVTLRGTQPAPVYTGTSSGQLSSPVAVINVTSSYGSRGSRHHNGVDLKAPRGTPIYASADGVVTFVGSSGSFGKIVKLSHGGGLETWYAHNDSNLVEIGETVTQGQMIATVGRTGNATTDHVHFEVRINGRVQNPMNYI